jgi:transcriptional regulator with XRE-family HTH domain
LLERGERSPTLRTVDRIAAALRVSPLELVES